MTQENENESSEDLDEIRKIIEQVFDERLDTFAKNLEDKILGSVSKQLEDQSADLSSRITELSDKVEAHSTRITELSDKVEAQSARLDKVESSLEKISDQNRRIRREVADFDDRYFWRSRSAPAMRQGEGYGPVLEIAKPVITGHGIGGYKVGYE